MINKKTIKKCCIFILSILTVMSIFGLNEATDSKASVHNYANNVTHLNYIFIQFKFHYQNAFGIVPFLLMLVIAYYYNEISKKEVSAKSKKYSAFLSIIFSMAAIIGRSLMDRKDLSLVLYDSFQVLTSVIKLIGYSSITYCLFIHMFIFLDGGKEIIREKQEEKKFDKHPILYTVIIILLFYLPYIVCFYPGSLNLDSFYQINQFYGTKVWNTQHPIVSTIVYGTFMKFGMLFNNPNLGLFLPNIIQLILSITLISYMINYFYKMTNNNYIRWGLILFFALVPVWPIHLYTEVKDIPFSVGILGIVYIFMKTIFSKDEFQKRDYILYMISTLVVLFFRHNGLHTIIICIPFILLMVQNKKVKKVLTIVSVATIIISSLTNTVLASALHVTKGSKKEMLSVPLQQTSAYIVFHEDELTEEEANAIDKVIEIGIVKEKFDPETIDYIKEYYKDPSNQELMEYFKVWFKMFFKHPDTYILATMNSYFGYIYPDWKEYKDGIALYEVAYSDTIDGSNLKVHYLDIFKNQRGDIKSIAYAIRSTPIGIIFSCGTYFWLLVIVTAIMIYYGKKRNLLPLIPLYAIVLITLISPINAYVRYFIPIMLSTPFIIVYTGMVRRT